MKNIRLLLLFLLVVNCTTEPADVNDISDLVSPEAQMCVDDLPMVRITNNGTHSFDFIIYDLDDNYTELFVSSISIADNSNWIELPTYNAVVVASNEFDYGQKVQLSLENCDTIEVVVDSADILTEL
ncbi:MAG: hypothetical protein AB8B52_08665 [Winogradskyella sp.]|uniref:hypothetical protein n=1 Tax=Winogradskyella sp. TaxID=1883156 RepID=UPI00385C9A09